ncbi:molybdenum cofactor guanylyltransferase MobA [Thermococcus sp.]
MIGAVLAGGKSRRFGGNKLLYRIDGKLLVLHTIERLESCPSVEEVVLIASQENAGSLERFGRRVVVDELLVGPLGGIYTALKLGDAFVVAGDMPSIVPELVEAIIGEFRRRNVDACVPRWPNGYIEPLHAAYSTRFRKAIEKQLNEGEYQIKKAIEPANVCYFPLEGVPKEWHVSFFNVNRKEEVKRIGPYTLID